MSSNLSSFGLAEMLRCSVGVRRAVRGAPTMESAARKACAFLYDELVDSKGSRACAMVRCYKTHLHRELEPSLQDFAQNMLAAPGLMTPELRCLTLLATSGEQRDWNDRRASRGHQAIPLPSASMVERAPMIAQLIRAFGLDLADVVSPKAEVMRDLEGRSYGVFFVPEARESPYIPAQDFVTKFGIRSVVGFGGALPSGDLFAVVLFAKVAITAESADRFRNLALDLKSGFFGYSRAEVFDTRLSSGQAPREQPRAR